MPEDMRCRKISKGRGFGSVMFSEEPISFFGGVNPETGIVIERNHPLEGECIAGKVLVFPFGKGSTVGSYILYRLKKNDKAPVAIVNQEAEAIVAVGAIISGIPMVDKPENGIKTLRDKQKISVNADKQIIAWD